MALTNALVQWNANTEPDLAGYRVYYGLYPGIYINSVDVGNVLQYTLQAEFTSDGYWYVAVSAYDTSDNESALSSVVAKRIVRVPSRLIRRA